MLNKAMMLCRVKERSQTITFRIVNNSGYDMEIDPPFGWQIYNWGTPHIIYSEPITDAIISLKDGESVEFGPLVYWTSKDENIIYPSENGGRKFFFGGRFYDSKTNRFYINNAKTHFYDKNSGKEVGILQMLWESPDNVCELQYSGLGFYATIEENALPDGIPEVAEVRITGISED